MSTHKIICFLSFLFISRICMAQPYTSYLTGNPNDFTIQPEFGICLMGGATEDDSAMVWFLKKAKGGDVVVIRTSGADGYNNYMYSQLGVTVNSVETLIIPSVAAATDNYVRTRLNQAEAIWIAGGNQANYVTYWKNTAVDSAINNLLNIKGGAVGGTSAGMAILGQHYFSAVNGSVTSANALSNPFHNNITIGSNDFIHAPFLENVITDTHYDNPDRKGRHSVFLARILNNGNTKAYGIACDEYTAVCIDSTGIARVFGGFPTYDDNAYFIQANCIMPNTPETILPSTPLTWNRNNQAIKTYKIKGTLNGVNWFNLNDWETAYGGNWEDWFITSGTFNSNTVSVNAPDCNTNEIIENYFSSIQIYPNPTSGDINLHLTVANNNSILFKIYDVTGKQIYTSNIVNQNTSIAVNHLPKGIYFLQLYLEDKIFTTKVLKQ